MRVEAIEPHGFCHGVKAAVAKARAALANGGAAFCLHELVHNEAVVAELSADGMRFVDDVDEAPRGATLLLSAHGVSPDVRRRAAERGLRVVDATCPFVARMHRQVRDFAGRGMNLVVVGHAGHVEVRGVVGEAADASAAVAVVADAKGVESLPQWERVGAVCQTTLSSDVVDSVLSALRARFPSLELPPAAGVCTATRERQDAVRGFVARGGDAVLVVGGAHSSNTRRLAEVAEAAGARAWLVSGVDGLRGCDFSGVGTLGVTSGASTPEDVFLRVLSACRARAV